MCETNNTSSEQKISFSFEHPFSEEIASFNYEANKELLHQLMPKLERHSEIADILYICSLTEIWGPEYINWICTENGPFMTTWNDKVEKLSSYIEYQLHSGCSYACTMRSVQLILKEKYKK